MVFPLYHISSPQAGLYEHYRLIAATKLAVVVCNRDKAIFEPETIARLTEMPNVIGLRDGYGDPSRLARMRELAGDYFLLMNGIPLAERFAPRFARAGIASYSPGVIDFLPELTWANYRALVAGDHSAVNRRLDGFIRPFGELREPMPGYGISLAKAWLRLLGKPAGSSRTPLAGPSPDREGKWLS